jgi:hypothetical protein
LVISDRTLNHCTKGGAAPATTGRSATGVGRANKQTNRKGTRVRRCVRKRAQVCGREGDEHSSVLACAVWYTWRCARAQHVDSSRQGRLGKAPPDWVTVACSRIQELHAGCCNARGCELFTDLAQVSARTQPEGCGVQDVTECNAREHGHRPPQCTALHSPESRRRWTPLWQLVMCLAPTPRSLATATVGWQALSCQTGPQTTNQGRR